MVLFLVEAALWAGIAASPAPQTDNWPQFRGPPGAGQSRATGLPLTWSETENVRWKTPIHGRGWSSPVVWGDQIWVTTAPEDGHEAFAVAVDRRTGKILHDLKVFDVPKPQEINALNSYASPTPVIEAGRVYVSFGAHGTACLDTATGRVLWTRRDFQCDHYRGPGSSPILVDDLLILHFDGFDLQYVVALDKTTGKTVWKTDRSTKFGDIDGDFRKAFCTPIVIGSGPQRQLVSPGSKAAMAYDLRTGRELWKIHFEGFSSTARPLAADGLVFLFTGFGKSELWAVRPDGQGDVTESHVAWKYSRSVPCKPSAVLVDKLIFMATDTGRAVCLEAATGRELWQKRLGGDYSASPIAAEGRVYFFSHDGRTTVIEANRGGKVLAQNRLDDGFMASPAVSGKSLILRTKKRLVCVESGG